MSAKQAASPLGYGWHFIVQAAYQSTPGGVGHGACAPVSWVRSYADSNAQEGSTAGFLHPNLFGQAFLAGLLKNRLSDALYLNGQPRSSTPRARLSLKREPRARTRGPASRPEKVDAVKFGSKRITPSGVTAEIPHEHAAAAR